MRLGKNSKNVLPVLAFLNVFRPSSFRGVKTDTQTELCFRLYSGFAAFNILGGVATHFFSHTAQGSTVNLDIVRYSVSKVFVFFTFIV